MKNPLLKILVICLAMSAISSKISYASEELIMEEHPPAAQVGGLPHADDEDEEIIPIPQGGGPVVDPRIHEAGVDFAYQNYLWDLRSARNGYRFYTLVGAFLDIGVNIGIATTTILAGISGMSSKDDGWDEAAFISGCVTGALKTLAASANKAADTRKKQANKLERRANSLPGDHQV